MTDPIALHDGADAFIAGDALIYTDEEGRVRIAHFQRRRRLLVQNYVGKIVRDQIIGERLGREFYQSIVSKACQSKRGVE